MDQRTMLAIGPYSSELYSTLLEPAYNQVKEEYLQYGRTVFNRDQLTKAVLTSGVKGSMIGALRAIGKVSIRNVRHSYEKEENKPPVDIYFVTSYLNFKNYPAMFNGLGKEMMIEGITQSTGNMLKTLSKALVNTEAMSFGSSIYLGLFRSFSANLIAASTVYPAALAKFSDYNTEEIIKKTIHKAGIGSLTSASISLGMSFVRALMPSYKRTIHIILNVLKP